MVHLAYVHLFRSRWCCEIVVLLVAGGQSLLRPVKLYYAETALSSILLLLKKKQNKKQAELMKKILNRNELPLLLYSFPKFTRQVRYTIRTVNEGRGKKCSAEVARQSSNCVAPFWTLLENFLWPVETWHNQLAKTFLRVSSCKVEHARQPRYQPRCCIETPVSIVFTGSLKDKLVNFGPSTMEQFNQVLGKQSILVWQSQWSYKTVSSTPLSLNTRIIKKEEYYLVEE